jgi:hypothetical protein
VVEGPEIETRYANSLPLKPPRIVAVSILIQDDPF